MNDVLLFSFLFLCFPAFSNSECEDEALLNTYGYAKPIPLEKAVTQFNTRVKKNDVGKTQPPLTAEEVLASLRYRLVDSTRKLESKLAKTYQEIVATSILPKGALLDFMSGCSACVHGDFPKRSKPVDINMWVINLHVWQDKYPAQPDSPIFKHQIREQYIDSKYLLTK